MIESRVLIATGRSPFLKTGLSGCRGLQFRERRHKKISDRIFIKNPFMVKAKVKSSNVKNQVKITHGPFR